MGRGTQGRSFVQANPGLGDAIPLGLVGATALVLGVTGGMPRRVGLLCRPTLGWGTQSRWDWGATALALGFTGGTPRRVGLLCSPTVGDAIPLGLGIWWGWASAETRVGWRARAGWEGAGGDLGATGGSCGDKAGTALLRWLLRRRGWDGLVRC
jgi:hypothetical protein